MNTLLFHRHPLDSCAFHYRMSLWLAINNVPSIFNRPGIDPCRLSCRRKVG